MVFFHLNVLASIPFPLTLPKVYVQFFFFQRLACPLCLCRFDFLRCAFQSPFPVSFVPLFYFCSWLEYAHLFFLPVIPFFPFLISFFRCCIFSQICSLSFSLVTLTPTQLRSHLFPQGKAPKSNCDFSGCFFLPPLSPALKSNTFHFQKFLVASRQRFFWYPWLVFSPGLLF